MDGIEAIDIDKTGYRSMLDSTSSDDRGSVSTVLRAGPEDDGNPESRHDDDDRAPEVANQPEMGVSYIDDDPSDGESFDDEDEEIDVEAEAETGSLLRPAPVQPNHASSPESYVYATPKPRPPSSPLPPSSSEGDEVEPKDENYPVEVVAAPMMVEAGGPDDGEGLREIQDTSQAPLDLDVGVASPGNLYEEPGEGLVEG